MPLPHDCVCVHPVKNERAFTACCSAFCEAVLVISGFPVVVDSQVGALSWSSLLSAN